MVLVGWPKVKQVVRSSSFWTAAATVAIAVTTIVYTLYAKKQWKAMEGQLTTMNGQLGEMVKQYPELKKSADAASANAKTAQNALTSSDNYSTRVLAEMAKQSAAMRESVQQTRTALHVSERAYLTISDPTLDTDRGTVMLAVNNGGRIPSGEAEVVVHEATFHQPDTTTPPNATQAIERYWKRHRFDSVAPGKPFSIAIPIHT